MSASDLERLMTDVLLVAAHCPNRGRNNSCKGQHSCADEEMSRGHFVEVESRSNVLSVSWTGKRDNNRWKFQAPALFSFVPASIHCLSGLANLRLLDRVNAVLAVA